MTRPAALTRVLWVTLALVIVLAAPAAAQDRFAITPVTVVDLTDGSLHIGQSVIVEGERITAVGPAGEVAMPEGAEVIDGAGGYLIPGLWDMHVHSAANVDWHFPLFLAHGVTGVRNLHTTVDTALALTEDIQRRLRSGELLGPRFLANGPIIDGERAVHPGTVTATTAAEGRAAVDSLVDGGADFIKVYDSLTREAYFAIMDQARLREVRAAGHVPYRIRPEEAARAGQSTDEHMGGLNFGCSTLADSIRAEYEKLEKQEFPFGQRFVAAIELVRALYDSRDPSLCRATLKAYRENGMAVVPNLVFDHNNESAEEILADSASMRLIPADMRSWWKQTVGGPIQALTRPTRDARRGNVRLMQEAGVMMLAGTDLGNPNLVPGISLHQELALLSEAGLSPLEALQTATVNPARYLGASDSLGTVEAGKLADLLLLEANPLDDITNTQRIRAVVADGRLYRRADLDRLLAGVETYHRQEKGQE